MNAATQRVELPPSLQRDAELYHALQDAARLPEPTEQKAAFGAPNATAPGAREGSIVVRLGTLDLPTVHLRDKLKNLRRSSDARPVVLSLEELEGPGLIDVDARRLILGRACDGTTDAVEAAATPYVWPRKAAQSAANTYLERLIAIRHRLGAAELPRHPAEVPSEYRRPCAPPAGTVTVWVDGCFDLFHLGHVRILTRARLVGREWARRRGERGVNVRVVAGILSEREIRAYKGRSPVLSWDARAHAVLLAGADHVTEGLEVPTPAIMREWHVDVGVCGGYTGDAWEHYYGALLREANVAMVPMPRTEGVSTSGRMARFDRVIESMIDDRPACLTRQRPRGPDRELDSGAPPAQLMKIRRALRARRSTGSRSVSCVHPRQQASALQAVLTLVEARVAAGKTPVVLVDLDFCALTPWVRVLEGCRQALLVSETLPGGPVSAFNTPQELVALPTYTRAGWARFLEATDLDVAFPGISNEDWETLRLSFGEGFSRDQWFDVSKGRFFDHYKSDTATTGVGEWLGMVESRGGRVAFCTGRPGRKREATEAALKATGLWQANRSLLMNEAVAVADSQAQVAVRKGTVVRQLVEQGLHPVALFDDFQSNRSSVQVATARIEPDFVSVGVALPGFVNELSSAALRRLPFAIADFSIPPESDSRSAVPPFEATWPSPEQPWGERTLPLIARPRPENPVPYAQSYHALEDCLSEEKALALHETTVVTCEALDAVEIPYVSYGGTLLQQARECGRARTDDDIDLAVPAEALAERGEALRSHLEARGHALHWPYYHGAKVFHAEAPERRKGDGVRLPFVDLWMMEQDFETGLFRVPQCCEEKWTAGIASALPLDVFEHRVRAAFDGIAMWAPDAAHTLEFLNRHYPDWYSWAVTHDYDHELSVPKAEVRYRITDVTDVIDEPA